MPSVMYLRKVRSGVVMSSNRIEYPTSFPSGTLRVRNAEKVVSARFPGLGCGLDNPMIQCDDENLRSISSATRFATDVAAIRLGCVHATTFPLRCGWSL